MRLPICDRCQRMKLGTNTAQRMVAVYPYQADAGPGPIQTRIDLCEQCYSLYTGAVQKIMEPEAAERALAEKKAKSGAETPNAKEKPAEK